MASFLLRRLSTAVLILLILSFVIFLLQSVSPGDPARAYVGANASNEAVARIPVSALTGVDQDKATEIVTAGRLPAEALTGATQLAERLWAVTEALVGPLG